MTRSPEQAHWLTLAYASQLKLERVKCIVNLWCLEQGLPLSQLFDLPVDELAVRLNLSETDARNIADSATVVSQQAIWQSQLEASGIQIVTRADSRYPLAFIHCLAPSAQPLLLFCQGNLDLLSSGSVAIVGGADDNPEKISISRELGGLLAGEGINTLSGMGRGVPRTAFDAALSVATGQVIGVLPIGICSFNGDQTLRDAIQQGRALLISPFHPNATFQEANALGRNQLIASLADAMMVIDLDPPSHVRSMIDLALQFGRGVYAWDPDLNTSDSERSHEFLSETAAMPISNAADVLDMIELVVDVAQEKNHRGSPAPISTSITPVNNGTDTVPDLDLGPEATLDLLSQSGRIPPGLAHRLQSMKHSSND